MTKPFDPVALKIGAACKRGKTALVEAGELLAGVKATLKHGKWLPWLKDNADALGFHDPSTASRLMKLAANPASTHDLWNNGNREDSERFLFTTHEHVALIKAVMGEIDLDPSSCQEANDKYVKARKFYTKEQDGLKLDWLGRVYLNPMYDADNLYPFVDKLLVERGNGNCTEAITLTPNSTDTEWFQKVFTHASAVCFHEGRVKFHASKTGKTGTPALGSAFAYFGPKHKKFADVFREIGTVVKAI